MHELKRLFFFARRPFLPSHNLLSTKEYSCSFNLRSKSLRCNAGTSHRFKAFSPPFCAKNRFRLVSPESFAKIFFGRALNRGRRTESRVLFGYFLHNAKSDKPFSLQRTSRFSKPRFSAQNYNFPLTKLKPSQREIRGSANLKSAPKPKLHTNPIKSFCRSVSLKHGRLAHVRSQFSLFRRSPTHKNLPPATFCTSEQHFPAAMPPFLLLTQHFLPLRGLFFGGHAAFLCCLWQPTAALRRLFSCFL